MSASHPPPTLSPTPEDPPAQAHQQHGAPQAIVGSVALFSGVGGGRGVSDAIGKVARGGEGWVCWVPGSVMAGDAISMVASRGFEGWLVVTLLPNQV